jgi:hypothetical protein
MKDLFKYFILPVIILYLIGVVLHFVLPASTTTVEKTTSTAQTH